MPKPPPTEKGTLKWQVTVPPHNTVTIICTCNGKTLKVRVKAGDDSCPIYFEWEEWGCIVREGGE